MYYVCTVALCTYSIVHIIVYCTQWMGALAQRSTDVFASLSDISTQRCRRTGVGSDGTPVPLVIISCQCRQQKIVALTIVYPGWFLRWICFV